MAQRKTPPAATGTAALDRVGPYALDALVRRDRMGEVWSARDAAGAPVRLRITPALDDPGPVLAAVDASRATRHPAVSRVLDRLVDERGRVAVASPRGRHTLADRRKRGRLDAATVGPLACALLDGLAALHAAGLSQGSVSPAAVAVDEDGAARWEDPALLPAVTASRMKLALRTAVDVTECAAMLRELGRLPPELEAVLDPVASGVPGAIEDAAALAQAWREALDALRMPVPPPGVRARVPGLLPPAPPPRRPRRQVPVPVRRVAGGLLVALALAIVPVAALTPGGRALADRVDAYAPLRQNEQLVYRLTGPGGLDVTVVLHVSEAKVIAGDLTAVLESQSSLNNGSGGSSSTLPLGLSGTTIRVHGDSLVRTVAGGSVRDLVLPFQPGHAWRDRRAGSQVEQSIVEDRALLGPVSLQVPAGRFDRCLAVALRSTTVLIGGPGATGTGTLWFCPGVGLARAHLVAGDQPLDVLLMSVH